MSKAKVEKIKVCELCDIYAYVAYFWTFIGNDTGCVHYVCLFVPEHRVIVGTFRPDLIKSFADRFGVNGDMALENILYGALASTIGIY